MNQRVYSALIQKNGAKDMQVIKLGKQAGVKEACYRAKIKCPEGWTVTNVYPKLLPISLKK